MNEIKATHPFSKHIYDQVSYGFIFEMVLPPGVTIASVDNMSVANMTGDSTTALAATGGVATSEILPNVIVNQMPMTIGVGRAVQALVVGGTADCTYEITIDVTASNGEKYGGVFPVEVYS